VQLRSFCVRAALTASALSSLNACTAPVPDDEGSLGAAASAVAPPILEQSAAVLAPRRLTDIHGEASSAKIVPLDEGDPGVGDPGAASAPKSSEIPDELGAIASAAGMVASLYSGYGEAVAIVTQFLKMMQVLPSTDSTTQQLIALSQHIDAAAGAINWYEQQATREDRINRQYTAIDTIGQAIQLKTPVAVTDAFVSESLNAAYDAEGDSAFERYWTDAATDGQAFWTGVSSNIGWNHWKDAIVLDRQANVNGFGYDWRLGVPELLQVLSLRIQVIAGIDPNFMTDGVFSVELERHRQALLAQYARMVDGVRCQSSTSPTTDAVDEFTLTACADINTGAAQVYGTMAQDADATPRMDLFRRQLLFAMPLFQTRFVADTLYKYEHNSPDLTAASASIAPAAAPTLCLAVQGAANANGTPVVLAPCDGSNAQHWSYDRTAGGSITNGPFNRCLDVQGQDLTSGAVAVLNDCNGNLASQHWTFDPSTGVLQNGVGTVLDVANGAMQAGTPVLLVDRNEGDAQRWRSGVIPQRQAPLGPSAPLITSISPSSGLSTGGTVVTLHGSGLADGMKVFFGSYQAPINDINGYPLVRCTSSTTCTVTTPSVPNGNLAEPITVSVNGVSSAPGPSFSYGYIPPTITSVVLCTKPTTAGRCPMLWSGQGGMGSITLDEPAPPGGTTITLTTGSAAIALSPSTFTIPAGSTTASFSVSALPYTSEGKAETVGVFAKADDGAALNTWITVAQGSFYLDAPNPSRANWVEHGSVSASLRNPAPAGGATIPITQLPKLFTNLPAAIVVPAGASTASISGTVSGHWIGMATTSFRGTYLGSTSTAAEPEAL
jgi:hypothetical protein